MQQPLLVRPILPESGCLPKLDVPTYDGDIIHWKQFWDQFIVSVHDRMNLSNAEKIVYLQHALKDGSAMNAIEGLSHSGDNYSEAVKCLKTWYDRPRLIHRAHIQKIVDTPSSKEGNGKELRRLHDDIQQHVRALKMLGCEPPGTFITSLIELKLDADTLFKWQKHSQSSTDIPHYEQLLDFLDLRVQASETSCSTHRKKPSGMITSFTASATLGNCVVCKTEKYPLYVCAKFKALSHDEKNFMLKTNNLCVNCLAGTRSNASQPTSVRFATNHTTLSFTLSHRPTPRQYTQLRYMSTAYVATYFTCVTAVP